MSSAPPPVLSKERLDLIVQALQNFMSAEAIRALSYREIQSRAWYFVPEVAQCMAQLRLAEDTIRRKVMSEISRLVYHCNSYALEAKSQTNVDDSSIEKEKCASFWLDTKERFYLILEK